MSTSMFRRASGIAVLSVAALGAARGASGQVVKAPSAAPAFTPATIREYSQELTTYPFSDPNPIPIVGRIYPYFRFDGFTNQPVKRMWKVIDLENTWIRVSILPEIGGKIWRAIDKASGKSFIYDNHVVKFRDIAMRGPWTSGGIEANYGIFGHTPNVSTPVDYVTQRGADGGVTCTIGALDLLTRTTWRLAISLPSDKAYFTTSSFWHNGTALEQPYYTWMNAAIPVSDDLEYVYPGNRFVGHDGDVGEWPYNKKNGKTISRYAENDFGGAKSYHVFGNYTDFFGVFWHKQDFGMARYAAHDEKPGKKLWIWGLARDGMIWEQLLTDADGQYSEVQSGRQFTQASDASAKSPFKHRGFAPYASDRWTEYWLPVKGTNGFVAANQWGALNAQPTARGIVVSLSPVQRIADTLEVFDGTRRIYARQLTLQPMERWRDTVPAVTNPTTLRIALGGHKLEWSADTATTSLNRPVVAPDNFNWKSSNGLSLSGKEKIRQRDYVGAKQDLERSLALDPHFVPALADLASLALRQGDAAGALRLARRALSIDTYDPASNFIYGAASLRSGYRIDAKDGFDVASQAVEYRSPAWTALAKVYLQENDVSRAITYATKALDYDRFNVDAMQVRAVAYRLQGDRKSALADLETLHALDPLSHFTVAERSVTSSPDSAKRSVMALIRNEMPSETLLELALWYQEVGQLSTADRLLSFAEPNPEYLYIRAFLHDRLGAPDVAALLARADAASPKMVFPFRVESADAMTWAMTKTSSWMPQYFLGLIRWHQGEFATASTLFNQLKDRPSFAPFYAARALMAQAAVPEQAHADFLRAAQLDPAEWRYGGLLGGEAFAKGDFRAAAAISADYLRRFPSKSAVAMLHVRALLRSGEVGAARSVLDSLAVLPFEGSGEAHALFREANLLGAVEKIRAKDAQTAQLLVNKARTWPERLGAGKPYGADEQLEDLLSDWIRRGSETRADLDMRVQQLLKASPNDLSARVLNALITP